MKRFTETGKWGDPWFRKLAVHQKVFWEYIRDNCDNAGVWKVDLEAASFHCGHDFESGDLLGAFSGRIRDIGNGRWWVEKFVQFQYGELSEASKPHKHVLSLLRQHRLSKGYPEGIDTLKDTDKEKDKDKDRGESEGRRPKPQNRDSVVAFCLSKGICEADADYFWQKWLGNGFKNAGAAMRDWQSVILSWRSAGHLPSQKSNNNGQLRLAAKRQEGTSLRQEQLDRIPTETI